MAPRAFPIRAVRALFLRRQHLDRPRARPLTASRLVRFAEDVGAVQLDSINVVDRAHYLAIWNRFGPYDRALLDRMVYRRRLFFEYWAHAACLVPTTTLPFWRRAMFDYHPRQLGWAKWLKKNTKVLAQVKAAIEATGPMSSGDFEGRRPGGGWWSWTPAHHALHHLWMTGVLTVDSRRHFHKRFDLLERAVPAAQRRDAVSSDEFARFHVRQSLRAMGAATERDLAWYLSFPRSFRQQRLAALRAMLAQGEAAEVAVEGSPVRWYALSEDLSGLRREARRPSLPRGTAILSPFDSLLWYRERVQRLFGFDYKIEVYTPGDLRKHGYYTMPVLHDGELIGRVDAKTHREEGRLEVRHVHFEPWFARGQEPPRGGARLDPAGAMRGVAEALASLAEFVGAHEVVLRRVTPQRLRAPLSRDVTAVAVGARAAGSAGAAAAP